ncbi:hypothetical protein SERLA73DRAFT_76210 [Serpula lacrymans var. lacrymans S7.3]|uniref:Exonuclease V n=1 Tax=Serpula lacrymans var. lacrymans (strain S7.3) TaxID=936435 RepID=F8Q6J2_SERL3|nr:hypothetical protein SERLA73DRAFT_76210 [Serpula lacrymans var. lacrymans S7.3]
MSSDHEFDAYDLSEFTEEDLACFDVQTATKFKRSPTHDSGEQTTATASTTDGSRPATAHSGGPAVIIAIEQSDDPNVDVVEASSSHSQSNSNTLGPSALKPFQRRTSSFTCRSPYQSHREWRGTFSVTDLVGPTWCEVQFDYGLRQMRDKRLEQRPKSFTTGSGKVITVKDNVAAQNDRIITRGKSVHSQLEREVHPVIMKIITQTEEERWGLRLHNLTVGLEERELPVFGILQNEVVIGVIDEIVKCIDKKIMGTIDAKHTTASPFTSPVKKKQRRTISPSQPQLSTISIKPSSSTKPGPSEYIDDEGTSLGDLTPMEIRTEASKVLSPQSFTLHVLDTKTRRTNSLPLDGDTYASKLQLMLYFQLLYSLISPEIMDFPALWTRLRLNPSQPFSRKFIQDIGWSSSVSQPTTSVNLDCFVERWWKTVQTAKQDAGLRGIDRELQIVYRPQLKDTHSMRKEMDKGKDRMNAIAVQEEFDVARAVEESLQELFEAEGNTSKVSTTMHRPVIAGKGSNDERYLELYASKGKEELPKQLEEDPELAWALHESLVSAGRKPVSDAATYLQDSNGISTPTTRSLSPVVQADVPAITILGTKEFNMDESMLDSHLTDVLKWWHGQRPARGVEIAHSHRCFTCEYRDGCEWRELKANEAAEILKESKRTWNSDAREI